MSLSYELVGHTSKRALAYFPELCVVPFFGFCLLESLSDVLCKDALVNFRAKIYGIFGMRGDDNKNAVDVSTNVSHA